MNTVDFSSAAQSSVYVSVSLFSQFSINSPQTWLKVEKRCSSWAGGLKCFHTYICVQFDSLVRSKSMTNRKIQIFKKDLTDKKGDREPRFAIVVYFPLSVRRNR